MGLGDILGGAAAGFAGGGVPGAVVGGIGGALAGREKEQAAGISAEAQREAAELGADVADPFRHRRGPFQDLLMSIYGVGPSPYSAEYQQAQQQPQQQAQQPLAAGELTDPRTGRTRKYGSLKEYLQDVKRSNEWTAYDTGSPEQQRMEQTAIAKYYAAQRGPQAASAVTGGTTAPGTGQVTNWQDQQPGQAITGGAAPQGTGRGPAFDIFKQLPGYQFALSEMIRGAKRAGAATGGLRSGKLLSEITERAGGLASQTYGSEMERLFTLSGANRGAPGTAGSLLSGGISGAGQTRASAALGSSNVLGYSSTRLADIIGGLDFGGSGDSGVTASPPAFADYFIGT